MLKIKILFVCTGNICRSPLGEGIFLNLVQRQNLQDYFQINSAGTGDWHVGENPDPRSKAIAKKHLITLPSKSEHVTHEMLSSYDYIIAMDRSHVDYMKELSPQNKSKIFLMRHYDSPEYLDQDIPDPYYDGENGFKLVFDMIHRSCKNLLNLIKPKI